MPDRAGATDADAQLQAMLVPSVLSGRAASRWIALPTARSPRLLLPTRSRLAATALRRLSAADRAVDRPLLLAGVAAVRAGLWRAVPRSVRLDVPGSAGENVHDILESLFGRRVTCAVKLGPARANRKPVLFVMTAEGEPLGFAKVGSNDVTAPLVRHEAAVLAELDGSPVPGVQAPRVLYAGEIGRMFLLVTDPLPLPNHGHGAEPPVEGTMALARSRGVLVGDLPSSAFRKALASALPSWEPQVAVAAERLLDAHSGVGLEWGVRHGDWTPWNVARDGDTVFAWDWERFGLASPVGYDLVHYLLARVSPGGTTAAALVRMLDVAPGYLERAGLPRSAVEPVVDAYLVDLFSRYACDRAVMPDERLDSMLAALGNLIVQRAGRHPLPTAPPTPKPIARRPEAADDARPDRLAPAHPPAAPTNGSLG